MNKKLKWLIVTVVLAAVAVAGAGVTLGVMLSDTSSSGSLTTADLHLSAKVLNVKVYSAAPAQAGDADVFTDENGNKYKYEQSVTQGDALAAIGFSRHEGAVSLGEQSVTIDGIMPGDKVEFDIAVTSTSTVSFQYRAELFVDKSQGEELLNQLEFSAGELGLRRQTVTEESDAERLPAVLTDYTAWTTFSGNQASIERIHVSIVFPITAQKGQGQTVTLYYVASGLQNTEQQPDVAQIETVDGLQTFKTLRDAVEYAAANGASEIEIVNDTVLEEGAVTVSRGVRFVGVSKADGTRPCVKGARISVTDGAYVTFENVAFGGTSYIDVSDATALTLTNCAVNITAIKFFDAEMRDYLSDAAFIVAGSSLTPVCLTVTDSTFVSDGGSAVCLRSRLRDASHFAGNTFGTSERPFDGSAVLRWGGAAGTANITVAENTLYGKTPLYIGSAATGESFIVRSSANKAYGAAGNVFADGASGAVFLDVGSTLNGNALTVADVAYKTLLFGGVDVTFNASLNITAGKIALSDSITEGTFYTRYVTKGALAYNAVALYKDGVLYGYLNSSDNDPGYTVDRI